ncbi:16S rRNA (adenine(1518)-N(6)/adenine(1519)-N(6))-dimethyltransferase RsmA [Clostridium akagii]|uniref:16S rRNA (adenine(1518)-N(6)/adenine(1519)-N(6))- dimethyltransferase RsmA n=1 Tax=Clostridium akagii TaxID=91623 RepID=UPI00047E07C3|nr:16S rRNA (adenine(1518)-N(6)/adenine(1519)-N(6))-dimethyltransferase RsmA [Clostridium akagii]
MAYIDTKEIVKKYKFRFTKSLGQNFLIDDEVLDDIIKGADISKDDFIIEIGPGIGTLTKMLLTSAKKVCAIELDKDLIPILQDELKEFDNLELLNKDALKVNFNEIIGSETSVKVVANLPYYLTTPMISKMLTEDFNFKSLTIMIQKEVAERMASKPDCKAYGALSLLVQYYCDVSIVRRVSPLSFIPQPKVDSIVIKLDKLKEPRVKVKDEELFFLIIRSSFNMRRKTLWNGLKTLKLSKEDYDKVFVEANIDPKRRGETLSIQEFGNLSDVIFKYR